MAYAMRQGGSRMARAMRRGQAGTPGAGAMTIRAWRTHGARSNNPRTPIEPESPRKGRTWGRLAGLHQRCVGCENRGPPGGSDGLFAMHEGWGDRRRGTRRIGAAAACERAAVRPEPRAVPGTGPGQAVRSTLPDAMAVMPAPVRTAVPCGVRRPVRGEAGTGEAWDAPGRSQGERGEDRDERGA